MRARTDGAGPGLDARRMDHLDPSTLIHGLLGALHLGALLGLLWRLGWPGRAVAVLILLPLLPVWAAWRGARWLVAVAREDGRGFRRP